MYAITRERLTAEIQRTSQSEANRKEYVRGRTQRRRGDSRRARAALRTKLTFRALRSNVQMAVSK